MNDERPPILLSPPWVGEAERTALLEAFDSGWIAPVGPALSEFERALGEVTETPGRVVALASGTAALHLSLLLAGVSPGDEVYCSTFTFAASANAITYCGANPTFIDSDEHSWNLDPELLHEALQRGRRTNTLPTAVVVVDLYGQSADFDQIVPACRELGIAVIEDAAEALGARYRGRPAGSLGDYSVLSFNGNKIITTSGGGALVCPDESIADRARHLATQARMPVVHYEHREVGYNYRMSNLLAGLGTAQLRRLPEIRARRLALAADYRQKMPDVLFMPVPSWSEWNGWLTCAVLDSSLERDAVIEELAALNVESRPLWKPMHLQPVFRGRAVVGGQVSEDLFDRGICLPSGHTVHPEDVERIADVISKVRG